MARRVYRGTGLKFKLKIEADGFNMDDNEFDVKVFTRADHVITFTKYDMQRDDDGNYIFTIDSGNIECGQLVMETTAYIPDDDFGDNIRKEIDRKILCNIVS